MYELNLTEDEMDAVAFVGGRYEWSRALLFHLDDSGYAELTEPEAWEIRDAFEADTEGGHSPFPLLAPDCALYQKLNRLWDSIV